MALPSEASRVVPSYLGSLKVGLHFCTAAVVLTFFVDYLKGAVKVDEYITHHRTLGDINEGFHDMHVSEPLKQSALPPQD